VVTNLRVPHTAGVSCAAARLRVDITASGSGLFSGLNFILGVFFEIYSTFIHIKLFRKSYDRPPLYSRGTPLKHANRL
jgi:hypothetical protein